METPPSSYDFQMFEGGGVLLIICHLNFHLQLIESFSSYYRGQTFNNLIVPSQWKNNSGKKNILLQGSASYGKSTK